jgi:hypothetical protein
MGDPESKTQRKGTKGYWDVKIESRFPGNDNQKGQSKAGTGMTTVKAKPNTGLRFARNDDWVG